MKEKVMAAKEISYTLEEFMKSLNQKGELNDIFLERDEEDDHIVSVILMINHTEVIK